MMLSDYLENAVTDFLFRGQAFVPPATLYIALAKSAPSDSASGTEVSGGGYARASIACSLANWAGTQGTGTTTASTGTSGTTSNNVQIGFPLPTADWGTITHMMVFDAATGGNLLYWGALTAPKTVNNGDAAPAFPAASLSFQIDN